MIFFVVLGRILSPALFGIVSTALIFIFLMRSTVLNAVTTSLVALPNPSDEDYDTGFWLLVCISVAALVFLNLAAAPLAELYRLESLEQVLRGTSVVVLLIGLGQAHYGWARRNFMFKQLVIRSTIGILCGGIVAIPVALSGYGLTALVLNQVVAGVVSLILSWQFIPWRPRIRFEWKRAQTLLSTAVPLGLTQSLQFAVQNFDTALVTYLLGPFNGGLYAAAKRIILAMQLAVWQPLAAVILPAFAELSAKPERLAQVSIRVASLSMSLIAPLFIGVAVVAEDMILVLFGTKWLDAVPVVQILCITGVLVPSTSILHQLLLLRRKTSVIFAFTLIQAALSIAAVVFIPNRSVEAIALCIALPGLITFIGSLAVARQFLSFPVWHYLIAVGRPLLAALVMMGVILFLREIWAPSASRLLAMIGVGGIVYALAAFLLANEAFLEAVALMKRLLPRRYQRAP